ncbi:MAG: alpha/beta hydrolase [Thiohalocapsa sp.]
MDRIHSRLPSRTHQRGAPVSRLPEALHAPRHELNHPAVGRIAYYKSAPSRGADNRPLLLIHSINAAPSSYEVKPIFECFQDRRPVYSIDLPGFGHSERRNRRYSPQLYADAINALLDQVIGETADVLALSLSAEFVARAALAKPHAFASLALISPTGFSTRAMPSAEVGRFAHSALSVPFWRQGLFDLLASKPSIRYFLNQSFSANAPEELIDYAYATAHQPGACHAPLVFLSTQLFTRNALDKLYTQLPSLPVLTIADRDPYVTFERLPGFAAKHPTWRLQTLAPHMGIPQWERSEATCGALAQFWRDVGPDQRSGPVR